MSQRVLVVAQGWVLRLFIGLSRVVQGFGPLFHALRGFLGLYRLPSASFIRVLGLARLVGVTERVGFKLLGITASPKIKWVKMGCLPWG